jgi:nucleoid-associated protein YgaU
VSVVKGTSLARLGFRKATDGLRDKIKDPDLIKPRQVLKLP